MAKSPCYTSMDLSWDSQAKKKKKAGMATCARNTGTLGDMDKRILGLTGCQAASPVRDSVCLKGIRSSVMKQITWHSPLNPAYMYVHTHTHLHISSHVHLNTQVPMNTYLHICTCTHTYSYAHTFTCVPPQAHTSIHTHVPPH